jgi:hypothetical protein
MSSVSLSPPSEPYFYLVFILVPRPHSSFWGWGLRTRLAYSSITSINLQFAKLEQRIYGPWPSKTMRNRIFRAMSIQPRWDKARGRPREKYTFEYISRDGRTKMIYTITQMWTRLCRARSGSPQLSYPRERGSTTECRPTPLFWLNFLLRSRIHVCAHV